MQKYEAVSVCLKTDGLCQKDLPELLTKLRQGSKPELIEGINCRQDLQETQVFLDLRFGPQTGKAYQYKALLYRISSELSLRRSPWHESFMARLCPHHELCAQTWPTYERQLRCRFPHAWVFHSALKSFHCIPDHPHRGSYICSCGL